MKPFVIKSLEQPNAIQKMLKQIPKINAFIEVNNLLATNEIEDITSGQIDLISQKYGVDIRKNYSNELLDLYREYIKHYLQFVDTVEKTHENSIKLRKLLGLIEDSRADEIWQNLASQVYKTEIGKIIINRRLTSENEDFLGKLANKLNIPENVSDEILKDLKKQKVQSFVKEIISDGRVSPQEEQELIEMSKSFDVNVIFDEKNQKAFNNLKYIWKIENEDLPAISPDINLPKKENCYFIREVDWYEYRTQTTRVRYVGQTYRMKITKGWYLRSGDLNFKTESKEFLQKVDHGKLYVTSKRLLFYGNNKSITIQLEKIIDLERFSDGVKIIKDTGKNVFIAIDSDIEILLAIITKLISSQ